MTCNQAIVLLDVRRGFDRERHVGSVAGDLCCLSEAGFIQLGDDFEYELTARGEAVCSDTLADLSYALRDVQE